MKSFLLFVFILVIIFGCYTRRKAEKQIGLAASTFPDILAKKARDLFPCVTTKGDTIWVSDSAEYKEVMQLINDENIKLYHEKDSLDKALKEIKEDTIYDAIVQVYQMALSSRDKIIEKMAYQLAHPPIITNTAYIHDTTVDNAAVQACMIDNSNLAYSLKAKTDENDGWRKKAKNRFWWILGMGGVIGVGGYFMISGFFKRRALQKLKSV